MSDCEATPSFKSGVGMNSCSEVTRTSRSIAEASPLPMAVMEGASHTICYANPSFCLLLHKTQDEIHGHRFDEMAPDRVECARLLDCVYLTGKTEIYAEQERPGADLEPYPIYWAFVMWPVLAAQPNASPLGVMLQVTEAKPFYQHLAAINRALVLSSLRQHELAEKSELLNQQLQQEILERTLAQEALIRSEKLASVARMAATTAHEINNPLAAAMNTLFLLQSSPELSAASRQYLDVAEGELKRIAHITRQTLGFYREYSSPATFNVNALLDSVISLMQSKITEKHAIVEKRCDQELQMTGIFGELRQVLTNLLANSLDAMEAEQPGRVKLFASMASPPYSSAGNRSIRIAVVDEGHGIGAETLPHLFEPFFTTKGSIGNGLGLWVSKQIIEKHAGSIHVRSATHGPQRGTTFFVTLPGEAA